MGRGFAPLKFVLGCLAVATLVVLGFLIVQGVKPTIKNPQPLNGSTTPQGVVTVSAEVLGETNLKEVRLTVDGKAVQPVINSLNERHWQVRYDAALPKGLHEVELIAIDTRGREQPYQWQFTASGPANLPKFANPLPHSDVRLPAGDVLISLAAFSESLPLNSLQLTLNGVTLVTQQGTSGANERTIASARRKLDPAAYVVDAVATDADGTVAHYQWKFTVVSPGQTADARFFPETSLYVFAPFAEYWASNGGLAVFGLPITPDFEQGPLTVQWFERARFEKHPELPAGQQVQLGRLGAEAHKADPPLPGDPGNGRQFFPQTGHSIGGPFLDFWQRNGGLALFGLPLTEEVKENGLTVQWFERARFEYHPENAGTPNAVELTQLGRQLWQQHH
ncbi:MAG: hypothetical protein ACTHNK_07610 [Thermomicrobiales bacterium]